MNVIRTICPRCHKETTSRTNVKDLISYTEEIVYKKCSKCQRLKDSPEDKLLKAIYGDLA